MLLNEQKNEIKGSYNSPFFKNISLMNATGLFLDLQFGFFCKIGWFLTLPARSYLFLAYSILSNLIKQEEGMFYSLFERKVVRRTNDVHKCVFPHFELHLNN